MGIRFPHGLLKQFKFIMKNLSDYQKEYGSEWKDFSTILVNKRKGIKDQVFLTINNYIQDGVLTNNFCITYQKQNKVTNNYAVALFWFDNIDTE